MKPALFISDLHLAPPRPAVATAFHAWARGPARDACAVYVLGDLFDEWIGDEQADDPFTREVVASLRMSAAISRFASIVTRFRCLRVITS